MTLLDSLLPAIGALLTLGTLSFLYGENVFYRFTEYTVVAVTTANMLLMAIKAIMNSAIGPLQNGEFHVLIALLLGLLYYSRYFGMPWLYRYPIAMLTGIGMGFMIRGQPGVIIKNVVGVIWPIQMNFNGIGAILGVSSLVFGLSFFTYTREHTGALGIVTKIGRYFIMAFIGQRFVGEVGVYISYLTGRLFELVNYLLGRV